MIPHREFIQRQERARTLARRLGVEALIVVGRAFYDRPGNLAYLTHYFPPEPTMVFGDGVRGAGHGLFVLPVTGDSILLTTGAVPEGVVVDDVRPSPDLGRGLAAALEERRLTHARIGIVGADIMPLTMYQDLRQHLPTVEWISIDPALDELRRLKSPAEQELLRAAVKLADKAHSAALAQVQGGATEAEVSAVGMAAAMRGGADFVRYVRVHAGVDSAIPFRWPQARQEPLHAGDMVTLDVIGARRGYGFDILRTTVVGEADRKQRQVLNAVLAAVEAMLGSLRAGVTVDALVRAGLQMLETQGYGPYARSFLGHGIGLETVELPYLVPENRTVLRAGEVLCIEPSIVIPGWGGASIENQVIVTEEGYELLDHTPRRQW